MTSSSPYEINLRHFRALLEICDRGSISAAAAALNLSQPAVTQSLCRIETLLGARLFERHRCGMQPTPVGAALRDSVRAGLARLASACRQVAGPGFEPERRLATSQLRALVALLDEEDSGAAAHEPRPSAAATLRPIRAMEAALQRPLLEARGRAVRLGPQGRLLAQACRRAFDDIGAGFPFAALQPLAAELSFGATPLALPFLVPEALAHRDARRLGTQLRVLEGGLDDLVGLLKNGVIDFIVGEFREDEDEDEAVVRETIHREPVVVAAGRGHPLVGGAPPSLECLASYPWIIPGSGSSLRPALRRLFDGGLPSGAFECNSMALASRLLAGGEMLTLATRGQLAAQGPARELAQVGEPLDATFDIGLAMRRGWQPSPPHARFFDILREISATFATHDPAAELMSRHPN